MKRTTNHNLYEVWCEYHAESVYVDHKPTKEELEEIRRKNWPGTDQWDSPMKLEVFKLAPLYTRTAEEARKKYHDERGEE